MTAPMSIFKELQGHPVAIWRSDGTRLHAIDAGKGQAVVLVHGYGCDMQTWSLVQPALIEHGLRAVAYDHRGHGGSTLGRDGTTAPALFDDLVAVIEQFDLSDVIIVGHSMGTFTAMGALAQTRLRKRTQAAILAAAETGTLLKGASASTKLLAPLGGLGVLPLICRIRGLGTYSAAQLCGPDANPEVIEATRRTLARGTRVTRGFFKVMNDESILAAVAAIDVPLTVIWGDADGATPEWHTRAIVERAPQAELTTVQRGGHMLNWEAPQTIVDAVLAAVTVKSSA